MTHLLKITEKGVRGCQKVTNVKLINFQTSPLQVLTKGRKREILPPVSNTKEEKLFQDN